MIEGKIASKDGTQLYTRRSGPKDAAKKVLVVHGYGEHCARYQELMDALANAGVESLAFDFRGHGKSAGDRGHIKRFGEYIEDVVAAHQALGGGNDTIVFGHSMGGLVSLHSVAQHPELCRALCVSAPYLGRALHVNPVKLLAGHALSRIVPKMALPTGLTGDHVTHDPKEAAMYDNDPLNLKKARARWFTETEQAMAEADVAVRKITVPVYWLHGESDPVSAFPRSREVFAFVASPQKEFVPLPGMRHEPLHEIERARIITMITSWVVAR